MSALPLRWRLRAGAAVALVPALLPLVSFSRLARWLGRGARHPHGVPDDAALAAWVDATMLRLPPPWRRTCLRRGAVLYHLLRRAGRPVELRIGVRREAGGKMAAHAWLALGNAPYLEAEPHVPTTFHEIARFGGER